MLTVSMDSSALAAKLAAWKNAAESGLKTGVAAGAQLFEDEAEQLVPVRTGVLRGAIHTSQVADTPQVQTLAVSPTVDADNKYGFDPAYARRIEFGFIGTDSLGRHYHQAPEPYMRPAYEGKRDDAAAAITDGISNELAGVA